MDSSLKQRLIGAAVLGALAVIFLPMLLQGPDVKEPDAAEVPIDMPAAPGQKFETREIPLSVPDANAPDGGVLGMPAGAQPTDAAGDDFVPEIDLDAPAGATPSTTTAATAASTALTNAATAPNTTAAHAGGNYAVNIGSFANLQNANAMIDRLRAQQLPVQADKVMVDGKPSMRVRVGPYADRATAEVARVRSEAVAGGTPKVVTLDAVAVAAKPAPAAAKPVPASVQATGASTKPAAATAVPPMPASATPAKPAAPSPTGYAVQLAAFANEKEALALRDKARAAGFVSFVQRVDVTGGVRFRVRLGPENDRAIAEKVRDSAAQKLGITGNVVRHP